MIISHKFRFIFVKTQKTAGTSIEVMLSDLCGERDVFTPINPAVTPHQARNFQGYWNPLRELWLRGRRGARNTLIAMAQRDRFNEHMDGPLLRTRVSSRLWRGYFKFCVERNPWDKTLSHYHYVRARKDPHLQLDSYLKHRTLPVNHPMYLDRNGQLLVDRVLRYEELNGQLATVMSQLGIPFSGTLDVRAKGDVRSDRRHYREIYTSKQKMVVDQAFATEIALLGYSY